MMRTLKAVLFDLDDTLYDHLHSAKHGLIALSQRYPAMLEVPVRELEDRYSRALEQVHVRLLHGEVTQTEARTLRMQELFQSFEIQVSDEQAFAEYKQFRRDYESVCRCVPGSETLLRRLRQLGLRLAIVTNNLVSEQLPKLEQLGIHGSFDVVSISEEVGAPKPDPKIFEITLHRLAVSSSEAVMVGDSLASDVAGARSLGMRTVWLNRRPDTVLERPDGVEVIKRDFSDHENALARILGTS